MQEDPQAKKAGVIFIWISLLVVIALGGILAFAHPSSAPSPVQKSAQQQALLQEVLNSAPVRGGQNATAVIVEFGDFECPTCRDAAPIINSALKQYPNSVKQVWVDVVNPDHPNSQGAAIAAHCAQQQGYFWEFHDILFDQQDNLSPSLYNQIASSLHLDLQKFQDCLQADQTKQLVNDNTLFAQQTGVTETPYLLINDQVLSGSFSPDDLSKILNKLLAN